MYGREKVEFTLEMFESITKEPDALKTYRSGLHDIQRKLLRDAEKAGTRSFIPTTFDAMMLDFGTRVRRKEL